ncbi:hypothetical protein cand_011440 [Cryptosporidium andersoni]|uniref:Uncharacterized protein n=1 Tax=Cryptosporidium andersoni TaxID=117008 RepID=A0A1J4MEF5_9CRYT|nr:hypothetical protein cand_011440 [Cryptosporidium andersoni]
MSDNFLEKCGTCFVDKKIQLCKKAAISRFTSVIWRLPNDSIECVTLALSMIIQLIKSELYSYSWYWYNHLIVTLHKDDFLDEKSSINLSNKVNATEFKSHKVELGNIDNLNKEYDKYLLFSEKAQHVRVQDARRGHWNKISSSKHLHWLGELTSDDNLAVLYTNSNNNLKGLTWTERLLDRMEISVTMVPDVNQCIGHAFAFVFIQKVVVEPSRIYEAKLHKCLDKLANLDKFDMKFGQSVGHSKSIEINLKLDFKLNNDSSLGIIKKVIPEVGDYIIKLTRLQRIGTLWCNVMQSISVGNTRKFLNNITPVIENLVTSLSKWLLHLGQLVVIRDKHITELNSLGIYMKNKFKYSETLPNKIFGDLYKLLNTAWRIVTVTSILVPLSKEELIDIVQIKYGTTIEALRKDSLGNTNNKQLTQLYETFTINNKARTKNLKPTLLVSLFDTLDDYWNACIYLHPKLHNMCAISRKLQDIMRLLGLPSTNSLEWPRFLSSAEALMKNSGDFHSATQAIIQGSLSCCSINKPIWDFINYQQSKFCGIDAAAPTNIPLSLYSNDIIEDLDFQNILYIAPPISLESQTIPLCGICALPVSTESAVSSSIGRELSVQLQASSSNLIRGRWYHEMCMQLLGSQIDADVNSSLVLPKILVPSIP